MDAIKITIESNAEEASKTFEDLAKAFGDADTQANDLRKDIKNLKTQIYQMTPGTEEYAQALVKLGDKMNTLGDIQRDLKASTGGLDTVFQTSTTALASFASGVSAASGIVALFGGNNEELAKTFVKLQAVMSIATGLKGFAGISKYTDSAIASLAAFITKMKVSTAAVNQDTAAKTKNIAATQAMNTANAKAATGAGAATGAIGKMNTATKGLSAAIKSATVSIGLWAAALAGIVLIARSVIKSQQEAKETEEAYQRAMGETVDELSRVTDAEERRKLELDRYIDYLKLIGAEETKIVGARESYLQSTIAIKSAELEHNKAIEDSIKWYNQSIILIRNGFKSRKELRNAIKDESAAVEALRIEYDKLSREQAIKGLDQGLTDIANRFEVSMAEGINTVADKLHAMIEERQRQIDELMQQGTGRGRTPGALNQEQRDLIDKWKKDIEGWEQDIRVYEAGVRKTHREEAKKTLESIKADETSILNAIKDGIGTLIDEAEDELERISNLALKPSEKSGSLFSKLIDIELAGLNEDKIQEIRDKIDELREKWTQGGKNLTKKQQEVLDNLTQSLKEAKDSYSAVMESWVKTLNIRTLPNDSLKAMTSDIVKAFTELGNLDNVKGINQFVENFKEQVKQLADAFSNGEITSNEYTNALNKLLSDYRTKTENFMSEIPGLVSDAVDKLNLEGENATFMAEAMSNFLMKMFYLPPSYLNNVKDTVLKEKKAEIEKILSGIEATYDKAILDYEVKYSEAKVDVLGKMFKGSSYGIDKQYLEDEKAALDSYYTSLISEYGRLAEEYANDAELHQKYLDLKLQAENNYRKAVADNTVALADLEREHAADTWNTYSNIAAGFSSLGSSIQDYYEYMAEYEAKNEEESRQYKIKGMRAQEFQAVANIAQGITAAIANAFQIPMPAGAIIAALESAAIAASGAVQIATIEKQIKALGGSTGSSSAVNNTSGLIDRVIMGDAQNANQQADLNAMFNGRQMSDTRVYVVEGDINNAQSNTRTAVTQNAF